MQRFGWPQFGGVWGVSAGGSGPPAPAIRTAITPTDTILFAGHSFVQTAYGAPQGEAATPFGGILQSDWPGIALSDYAAYASIDTIIGLNGALSNARYRAAIICEFTNPAGAGFPAFDSTEGRASLQAAYTAAMKADAVGGEIIIQDIWPPQGRTDLYANATGFSQGLREWLEVHTGRPVWIIPAFPFVEAMRAEYGDAIYEDGLHLVRGDSPYPRGMSYLVYSFLTQQRCPFVRDTETDRAIDQMAWDTLQAYECAGMGGAITYASTLPATDPLPSPVAPAAHPLQPYIASGTIAIYLDTNGTARNAAGNAIKIANRGAGGATFNAPVTGNPIPLSGNTLQMSGSVGTPILATPASIDGVRLMWAISTDGLTSSMRFMGSATDEIRLGAIQTGSPNSAFLQFWSNRSGSGVSSNPTPRIPLPASGMHLFECEVSIASQYQTAWVDGPQVATLASFPHSAFTVDRIGQGTGATLQFVGQMGGMTGVITGRPDTAAAISAVRAYWSSRFGITIT